MAFILVAALSAIIFIVVIYILPRIVMMGIVRKLLSGGTQHNEFKSFPRPTHESRTVVIPCPDFFYSTVAVSLHSAADALLITAPASEYASLGVYDCNAKCTEVVNQSGTQLQCMLLSVFNNEDDRTIRNAFFRLNQDDLVEANLRICRMKSATGLLLHRLLVPDPTQNDKYKLIQDMLICKSIALELPKTDHAAKIRRFGIFTGILLFFSLPFLTAENMFQLHNIAMKDIGTINFGRWGIVFIVSVIIGSTLAFLTIRYLKNPKYASRLNLTKSTRIGSWKFHMLSTLTPNKGLNSLVGALQSLLRHIVTFLHGALGLLPSEVIYGTCITDSRGDLLEFGRSYLIKVPKLDLRCQWWSITLYGADLFLIPNDQGIYSVNSYQLENTRRVSGNKGKDMKILCGPKPPSEDPTSEQYADFWIPLPENSTGKSDSGNSSWVSKKPSEANQDNKEDLDYDASLSAVAPRLVIRGKPDFGK